MICLKWRVKKREEPTTKNTQKDSFRFDGEIKNFPDKQKLREFSITKPALQQMLRKFSRQETQEEERLTQDKPQAIKKMVIESYISIIILSENGLNVPTKRHKLSWWKHVYVCTSTYQITLFNPSNYM